MLPAQALAVAQAQGAGFGSCARRSASPGYGATRASAEARDLLAPVYGWFTEGFGTADLKDAKALQPPGRASKTPAKGVPQGRRRPRRELPGGDLVPVAADQRGAAARAVGALAGLVVDVAGVDVAQPVAGRDIARSGQRGGRRVGMSSIL